MLVWADLSSTYTCARDLGMGMASDVSGVDVGVDMESHPRGCLGHVGVSVDLEVGDVGDDRCALRFLALSGFENG
eukprot:1081257-Amorphochlora_amoeboformis.AAC.1